MGLSGDQKRLHEAVRLYTRKAGGKVALRTREMLQQGNIIYAIKMLGLAMKLPRRLAALKPDEIFVGGAAVETRAGTYRNTLWA